MWENPHTIDPKSTNNHPKSRKISPWSVFGSKSRPGRHQVGPTPKNDCSVGAVLAENGASRVDFVTP